MRTYTEKTKGGVSCKVHADALKSMFEMSDRRRIYKGKEYKDEFDYHHQPRARDLQRR